MAGASGKVVKALRGGVQDVAVKQLLHTNAAAVEKFLEVSQPNEANHISRYLHASKLHQRCSCLLWSDTCQSDLYPAMRHT